MAYNRRRVAANIRQLFQIGKEGREFFLSYLGPKGIRGTKSLKSPIFKMSSRGCRG